MLFQTLSIFSLFILSANGGFVDILITVNINDTRSDQTFVYKKNYTLQNVYEQNEKLNKSCKMGNDQFEWEGSCQRFSTCKTAQDDWKIRKVQPKICDFDVTDQIVCCRSEKPTLIAPQKPRRKSEQACANFDPKSNSNSQIEMINGTLKEDQYSYMAQIGWIDNDRDDAINFIYAGVMITENLVLVSAQSTARYPGGRKWPDYVRVGIDTSNSILDLNRDIPVEQVYVHPNFTSESLHNDIAIIKLNKRTNVTPPCLWQTSNFNTQNAVVVGYNLEHINGSDHENRYHKIEYLNLKITPNEECAENIKDFFDRYPGGMQASELCAGDNNNLIEFKCPGSSGGPLLIKKNGISYVIAVTSFGSGCIGTSDTFFTRVSSYLDWIESIAWP